MSLLFAGGHTSSATFSASTDPSHCIRLGQNEWDALTSSENNAQDIDRVAVVIEPLGESSLAATSGLTSIVEWAQLDTSIQGVQLPSSWPKDYPHLIPGNLQNGAGSSSAYRIERINPVTLSEVVFLAKSSSAVHLAHTVPGQLKQWVCGLPQILRHGATYSFNSAYLSDGTNGSSDPSLEPSTTYEFEVIMTQPVLQGVAHVVHTTFIVTASPEQLSSNDSSDGYSTTDSPRVAPSEYSSDLSDIDGIEIGEGFLANSVPPLTNGSLSASLTHAPQWTDSEGGSLTNGASNQSEGDPESSGVSLFPEALAKAIPPQIPCTKGDDPESHVFVASSELGRLGLFSGDWAVLSSPPPVNTRLARLIADDALLQESEKHTLLASPLFLHNLGAEYNLGLEYQKLSVQSTPFGSRPPSLPTARSITVARVASPHVNDRAYQPLFIRALKEYFDDKVRLLRMGDLIAVPIHSDYARLIADDADRNVEEESSEDFKDTLLSQEFPLASQVGSGVVFFEITNIEHDVADIKESQNGNADTYFAATMGELGCWVDSKVTQIMQTGLEHSRVPDVTNYLGVHRGFAVLPRDAIPGASTPFARLLDLVSAALLPTAVDYDLRLSILLKGARGIGKQTTARWVAQRAGLHFLEINCYDVVGETDLKTEATLRARVEKAADCSPCILYLRHIEALARNTQTLETGKEPPMASILQDCLADLRQSWILTGHPVFVIASSTEPEKIPQGVLSCFKHEITFEVPAEAERAAILLNLVRNSTLAPDVSVKSLATQTAALVAADLVDLVQRARNASVQRSISVSPDNSEVDCIHSGLVLTGADFETALNEARNSYSESIGAPKIPNVTWDDVGGLASVKKDILDTIQLPLDYPELFADGLKKRSGILLYGPPGTGKTLLAKAVATSCSLNFFSVKGPELLNMYIGESEANVRRVFQRARDAKPCVIFFDELDSVAPKRGNHGDSGGVMDRIVSQLLAELDGMADGSGGADVFVIGATNRPDLLDSALLRPGRFDRMLYLSVSDTHEAQLNIMRALTRKFRLDPALDLKDIADQCSFNYTGADFYALCSDAMLKSMARKAEEIDARIAELNAQPPPYSHPHPLTPQYYLAEMATPEEIDVLVSKADFELALKELVPSVSQDEMDHYAEVQRKFANDTINSVKEKQETDSELGSDGFEIDWVGSSSQTGSIIAAPQTLDKGKGKAVD